METYSSIKLSEYGIEINFVQDNHSFSHSKNILRGLHFQLEPKAQTKLVRCTRGAVFDVAVDLRSKSPTYKKHFAIKLSAENKMQLLIPKGFAHGFLTLKNNTEVIYKVDEHYCANLDRSINYNDPQLAINWRTDDPLLSNKDKEAPFLAEFEPTFDYSKSSLVKAVDSYEY
jgi:dTDP-4-dehydrorhamnose 3,5-epimerase